MQVLNIRKAKLYPDNTCKICQQETKTQDHLATCPKFQKMWCILEREISELLVEKTTKEKEKLETTDIQKIQDSIFGRVYRKELRQESS